MPTALVTGASGFIGRALCRRLVEDGWCVRGAVRSEGSATNLPPGVAPFRTGEVGPDTDWAEALRGVGAVVHLAAKVPESLKVAENLDDYLRVNLHGTISLAQAAVRAGVSRLVFLSSAKVHGEGREAPYREDDVPDPRGHYALSKWQAEQALAELTRGQVLETVILRPPLVYGPGVRAGFLRLLRWVDRGIPVPVGRVRPRRSMIYIGNLVDAIAVGLSHPASAGKTFLVDDGQDTALAAVLLQMAQEMGRNLNLFPMPPVLLKIVGQVLGKSGEVDRLIGNFLVDGAKIQHSLGWRPPVTQEEGLRQTVNWYLRWQR